MFLDWASVLLREPPTVHCILWLSALLSGMPGLLLSPWLALCALNSFLTMLSLCENEELRDFVTFSTFWFF